MSSRLPLEPAPARGCYDRGLPRNARHAEQRERLTQWVAEVYRRRGEATTVQDLVKSAGVGRNTFYEYFDGLEHALDHASQVWARLLSERIVSSIEQARTPIARLRALSRAWFEQVKAEPAAMDLLLRRPHTRASSVGGELFQSLLRTALAAGSTAPAVPSEAAWETCAACAAEGASLVCLRGAGQLQELQAALSLMLTRVFR